MYIGGFCGYRNIQMMCSYIIGAESQGHEGFNGKIPSIFDIQDYIETAWDFGINSQGRIETGGIRGTRKYIGTPDVSIPTRTAPFFISDAVIGTSNVLLHRYRVSPPPINNFHPSNKT